jgi:rhodanese-related sulfurtransferase
VDLLRITRTACALLAALTLVATSCGNPRRAGQPQPIGAADLAERIHAGSAPLILDVRTREEYAAGHIPSAVNIPHGELSGRLPELGADKADEVVVLCRGGTRAAFAEDVLARAGYTNLRDLEGHMQAWQEGGYPTQ